MIHDEPGSPARTAFLDHDCNSSDASFVRSVSDQCVHATALVGQPSARSRSSVLLLGAACVCALFLGVLICRLSQQPWQSRMTLISRRGGADSVPRSIRTASPAADHNANSRHEGSTAAEGSASATSSNNNTHVGTGDPESSSIDGSTATAIGSTGGGGTGSRRAASSKHGSSRRRRRGARLSSRRIECKIFPLQRQWDWSVHFNPAAVYHPKRGWVVVMRHEREWWGPSPALTVMMGKDPDAPDADFAADHQFLLEQDTATLGPEFAQQRYGKKWLKVEDLRPFLWKGGVHATASVWGEDSGSVWECILRLDLESRLLAAEYCFDKMPIRTNVTIEKNWALAAGADDPTQQLLILHQLAPCLVWLRFAPAAPKGLELISGACFSEEQRAAVRDFTGAPLSAAQHISGHLVPFPRSLAGRAALDARRRNLAADGAPSNTAAAAAATQSGGGGGGGSGRKAGIGGLGKGGGGRKQKRRELFLMAHTRHGDGQRDRDVYSHWGFRFDAATLQLTHVSRGPVASSYMAAQPHDYLVVLSYHFVKSDGADALLLFYGRNNTHACFDTIAAETIGWYEVPPGSVAMDVGDPQSIGYQLQ